MNSSNTKQTNVKPAINTLETKTRCWQFEKSLEKYEQLVRGVMTHYGHGMQPWGAVWASMRDIKKSHGVGSSDLGQRRYRVIMTEGCPGQAPPAREEKLETWTAVFSGYPSCQSTYGLATDRTVWSSPACPCPGNSGEAMLGCCPLWIGSTFT